MCTEIIQVKWSRIDLQWIYDILRYMKLEIFYDQILHISELYSHHATRLDLLFYICMKTFDITYYYNKANFVQFIIYL